MLDRTKQPPFKLTTNISLPKIEQITLKNNIPITLINLGNEPIVQIILNFKGGSWIQKKRLVASTTNRMLKEGTKNKNSKQIAEIINFYAADIKFNSDYHFNKITITVLNKYIYPILELIFQLITQPTFPEKELQIYLKNKKQEYIIELENLDVVARNLFHKALFGFNHPYGTYALPEDFDKITQQDLFEYHKNVYNANNLHITIGGKIDQNIINAISSIFQNLPNGPTVSFNPIEPKPNPQLTLKQPKPNSLQSAIMLGAQTITPKHPDYNYLNLAVAILGGYFGSRLMTNIRETKGLSYGISASIESSKFTSILTIEAQVRKENSQQVIDEIHKEITKLKQFGITDQELLTVKNYALSSLLRLINGAFPLSKLINRLKNMELSIDYIKHSIDQISSATKEQITSAAQKYLCFEKWYKIIVG